MVYDIYGNRLRKGYCEVHPNVPEIYPCFRCECEYQNKVDAMWHHKQMQKEYDETILKEYIIDYSKKNSRLYRFLLLIERRINNLTFLINKKKDKIESKFPN